ncbi:MAG: ATP-binding cassette domain-containing protein [Dermabacter sp.]|nr:ATP-binding cassette domain-containing protein [Dermabacter sp.]
MNAAPRPPHSGPHRAWTSPALQRMQRLMQISERQILTAALAGALTLASAFALAAVSGYLITKAWTMPPVLDLSVAVVSVRALGISRGIFRYLERLLTHDAALTGVSRLRTNLYAGLTVAPDALVSRLRRGDLLARIGDDAEDMANDVIRSVIPALVATIMAVVVIATIVPFSPVAGVFILVALVIATLVAPALAFRAALITERDLVSARTDLTALTLHAIDNADALRVAGRWEETTRELSRAQARFDESIDRAAGPAALSRAGVSAAMIPALLGSILAAGAVFTSTEPGILGGLLGHTPGIIGVLLLVPLSSFEAATVLPQAASQRARSLVAAARLHSVDAGVSPLADTLEGDSSHAIRNALREASGEALSEIESSPRPARRRRRAADEPSDTPAPHTADAPAADADAPGPGSLALTADLRAHGLTVGWTADRPLAQDVSLNCSPGSRTLIYGASGRGKTTLAMTLAGLIPPLDGNVSVGGHDLRDLSEHEVRERVVFFAEDAHIFATTVRENLRVVRGTLTDEEARHALEAAGLGAWLAALPLGLDTPLGSGGSDVSGGERRRLLLARAIARRAPVTILDEPTEHLDMDIARRLMEQILTPGGFFEESQSVIVITHDTRFASSGAQVLNLDTLETAGPAGGPPASP